MSTRISRAPSPGAAVSNMGRAQSIPIGGQKAAGSSAPASGSSTGSATPSYSTSRSGSHLAANNNTGSVTQGGVRGGLAKGGGVHGNGSVSITGNGDHIGGNYVNDSVHITTKNFYGSGGSSGSNGSASNTGGAQPGGNQAVVANNTGVQQSSYNKYVTNDITNNTITDSPGAVINANGNGATAGYQPAFTAPAGAPNFGCFPGWPPAGSCEGFGGGFPCGGFGGFGGFPGMFGGLPGCSDPSSLAGLGGLGGESGGGISSFIQQLLSQFPQLAQFINGNQGLLAALPQVMQALTSNPNAMNEAAQNPGMMQNDPQDAATLIDQALQLAQQQQQQYAS